MDTLDLPVHIAPILSASATHNPAPDAIFDASGIILTSPNGLRFATLPARVDKTIPLYAVGAATAKFAQDAGWQNVITGTGDIIGLADVLRREHTGGTLVHIRGVYVSPFTESALADFDVKGWQTYETRADAHSLASIPKFLSSPGKYIIVLQSARAADLLRPHVQAVMERVESGNIAVLCLSKVVLESISPTQANGFYCCEHPDEDDVLGRLRDISQMMTHKDFIA